MEEQDSYLYNLTAKLLILGLVIAILILGKQLLIPLAVALLFSFLLLPISQRLEKWRVPRTVSIIISIFIALLAVAALIYFFYKQVLMFVNDWPELSKQVSTKIDSVYNFIHEHFNYSKVEQKNWVNDRINTAGQSAGQVALGLFTATGSFIATVALLPIFIFFLTYYRDKFKKFIQLVFKEEKANHTLEIMKKISSVSQSYLKGLFLVIVILSVLNSIGFMAFGLRHAILFGVLAALLNIIPYIGVLIGSILPITMALITLDQFSSVLGIFGVVLLVQFLENNFITPLVVGSSVSINPFSAILALTVSFMIWGIMGMIVALPFMGMLKVLLDNVESLKPYGYLIGEEADYYTTKSQFANRIFRRKRKDSEKK